MEPVTPKACADVPARHTAPRGVGSSLSAEIHDALVRERRRIAQDLHDDLGHRIALLKLKLQSIGYFASERQAKQCIREVLEELDCMSDDLYDVINDIRQVESSSIDLANTIEEDVNRWKNRTSCNLILEICGEFDTVNSAIKSVVSRCLDEALMNVVKHALTASVVEITLQCRNGMLTLSVRDDGRLYADERSILSSTSTVRGGKHFGLIGLRERLAEIGGALDVGSSIPRGWLVVVRVPVGDSHDEASGAREDRTR